jgi:hypothetical protein
MSDSATVEAAPTDDLICSNAGFFVFPGSHKANWALPPSAASALSARERRLPPGCLVPHAPAGSVTLFSEACVHGTWGWSGEHDRRCILFKYSQKHITQGAHAVIPGSAALTMQQARLFKPPEQRGLRDTFHPTMNEEDVHEAVARSEAMRQQRMDAMRKAAASSLRR